LIADARFRAFKDRYDHRAELESIIADIMMTRTAAEWHEILDIADVPHGTVNSIGEALAQPVIRERGFVKEMQHPTAGTVRVLGSPLRFAGATEAAISPPPLLGEHTRQVLEYIAKIDIAEIERLIAAGVVGTPEHRLQKKSGEE
jgi:crotonobetainyl-CoA:carnitine CoA-transferase CaiB-like acyl-CoA transferase